LSIFIDITIVPAKIKMQGPEDCLPCRWIDHTNLDIHFLDG